MTYDPMTRESKHHTVAKGEMTYSLYRCFDLLHRQPMSKSNPYEGK